MAWMQDAQEGLTPQEAPLGFFWGAAAAGHDLRKKRCFFGNVAFFVELLLLGESTTGLWS